MLDHRPALEQDSAAGELGQEVRDLLSRRLQPVDPGMPDLGRRGDVWSQEAQYDSFNFSISRAAPRSCIRLTTSPGGVIPSLQQLGRTDLAMVGFGDFPMARALHPAVSVIDQNPSRLGRARSQPPQPVAGYVRTPHCFPGEPHPQSIFSAD